MELAHAFGEQARACRNLGSPMYGELLTRCAHQIADPGSALARVLAAHREAAGPSAIGLRLMGSAHRLVLERRAGALALYYPSVGGVWDPQAGWQAFIELVDQHPSALGDWLDRAPQTNEVGRSVALFGALSNLPDTLPIRLFEIGASAGLNLLPDKVSYVDTVGRRFGAQDSLVRLRDAWAGPIPARTIDVVERRGVDVLPINASSTSGRLALSAYVWADHVDRFERLRAALELAADHPICIEAGEADAFVDRLVLQPGTHTVLWHSVMWQYLPALAQQHITRSIQVLGSQASAGAPFSHVRAEPRRVAGGKFEFCIDLTSWPSGQTRRLGTMAPHGVGSVFY